MKNLTLVALLPLAVSTATVANQRAVPEAQCEEILYQGETTDKMYRFSVCRLTNGLYRYTQQHTTIPDQHVIKDFKQPQSLTIDDGPFTLREWRLDKENTTYTILAGQNPEGEPISHVRVYGYRRLLHQFEIDPTTVMTHTTPPVAVKGAP